MKQYFQPELTAKFLDKNPDFYSFYVFRSKKLVEKVFPDANILTFTSEAIEKPKYVDYMYDSPLYHLKLEPLQKALKEKLGFPIKFKTEIVRGRRDTLRMELKSDNLINKAGIFALPLEYVHIGNFGGGEVHKDSDGGQFIWFNMNMYYKHKEGGRNGLNIAHAWYFIDKKKWEFEFVGEKIK